MFFYVFMVISVALLHTQNAGGYMEQSRAQHITSNTQHTHRSIPTLSYDYQLSNSRQKLRENTKWEPRQGSYYAASIPKVKVPNLEQTPSMGGTKNPPTGVFKTYGKGQMKIPYRGATVHVPKTFGSNKAHRAMISTRVFDPPKHIEFDSTDVISRSRRDCAGCPKDEMVVASRGHNYVILPEPCSYKWLTITGPKPGTKLTEGVHYITGTMGHRKKVCQYKYQVVVRKCPPIEGKNMNVTCSAENAWGSECNIKCVQKYELKGDTRIECGDDFQWIDMVPQCIANFNCLLPDFENGTKINCETNELSDMSNDYLPEGAYCRLRNNGIDTAMKCRKGEWKKVFHNKSKHRRNKHLRKVKNNKHDENICKPDTCFNEGKCINISQYDTFVCVCKPTNKGVRCEEFV